MEYYEVLVASPQYHGTEALTYYWPEILGAGSVVAIPLKNQLVVGIVIKRVAKPRFQTKSIDKVISPDAIPPQLLKLHAWVQAYYPAPLGSITQLFVPTGLLTERRRKLPHDSELNSATRPLPVATEEQRSALKHIMSTQQPVLLHGDTGTGKTRIYLELAERVLADKRSVLILTPEISLTPQLIASFTHHITAPVIAVHSTLTDAQRRDAWLRIATATSPLVVIGPRSSLFYPVHDIGLIVIDEMHDGAFKQEQSPRYHTTRVAAQLATFHKARLILGSATPPVIDYYIFEQKKLPIIRMHQPAIAHSDDTKLTVVDMRDRQYFTRSPWLSEQLIAALDEALLAKRQSLVFLNRRGSSRLVLCQTCGWEALCRHCNLPLTYHHDHHSLICHTCGRNEIVPTSCPHCQSAEILFKSIGTKMLESELQRIYPEARIARFDSDTPETQRLDKQYENVKTGGVDIIIGTQMISKGLDLPLLSVVGVALADTSLYFPDYTAEESTFQMISQVTGRVGRGHGASTIVIQTYSPESIVIKAALQKDYVSFYQHEISARKNFYFPPFCFTLKLRCSKKTASAAQRQAQKLANELTQQNFRMIIEGPSPSFTEKINGSYRWQIIIKSPHRNELLQIIKLLPSGWTFDLEPLNLL